MTGRRKRGQGTGAKKRAPAPTKKAVPPPDNPLGRRLAEDAARGGLHMVEDQFPDVLPLGHRSDELRALARKRAEALEQTKRMPTGDAEPGASKPDPE